MRTEDVPLLLNPTILAITTSAAASHKPLMPGGLEAIISHRELIAKIPLIGQVLAEHGSNFGYTAGIIVATTGLGRIAQELGDRYDNSLLQIAGELLPTMGIGFGILLNILVEFAEPANYQFVPDIFSGILGIAAAHYATTWTLDRFAQAHDSTQTNAGKT